jgi:hypothetical protein
MSAPRISHRTGRPVRRYDDQVATVVKALDFDERAIRKLAAKWPLGCRIMPRDQAAYYEPWPRHLAAVLISVLEECGPIDPLLGYTPPDLRAKGGAR